MSINPARFDANALSFATDFQQPRHKFSLLFCLFTRSCSIMRSLRISRVRARREELREELGGDCLAERALVRGYLRKLANTGLIRELSA